MREDLPVSVDLIEAIFHAPKWPGPKESAVAPAPASTLPDPQSFMAPEWRDRPLEPRRTADIFSIGAVLFYAATGRVEQFPAADREETKKAVSRALQNTIAVKNYGVADVVSRCLRFSPDDRVADARTVLSDIRLFRGSPPPINVRDVLRVVSRASEVALSKSGDVFGSLAAIELEEFESAIAELEGGSLTVGEGHENLVLKLCSYLSTLGADDEYWAVTIPDFWRQDNLGVRGRYLSMNGEIVRRGARVRRVFLLTEEDTKSKEVQQIVAAQIELDRDIVRYRSAIKGSLDLRFLNVSDEDRKDIRTSQQFGVWVRGDSLVQVKPIYNSKGVINRVTIRRLPESRTTMKTTWFDNFFERAEPLGRWKGIRG
jgi:hypothetical protein